MGQAAQDTRITASRSQRSMRAPLSVCMIALDEADNLPRCLDSVLWADEVVVVVDDRTRDGTEAIARDYGARVVVRSYAGDIGQKSHAIGLAKHEWVLQIDPDEVVTPELATEIREVVQADSPECSAWEVNRITFHLGRWIRHGDFYPDWILRLFRKSAVSWSGIDPHGRIVHQGPVRRLRGHLQHFTYRDLADQMQRVQTFSDYSAQALYGKSRRATLSHLFLRPPLRFLRAYVLKGGYRDGMPGFIIAAITSFHVFLKYAKLWELTRLLPEPTGERKPALPPFSRQASVETPR